MADPASLSLNRQQFEAASAFLGRLSDRMIETGIARIYLGPEVAWKIKKPVNLGYLDYSTQDKRVWAVQRELEMNRAYAPDIYRRVRYLDLVSKEGACWSSSAGEPVLEMRRFDPDAVLSNAPERLKGSLAEALGRLILDMQMKAITCPEGGGFAALDYVARSNAKLLRGFTTQLDPEQIESLVVATDSELERHRDLLNERAAAGLARRCHADLHLGNILLEDERLTLFDCIEFNDVLTDIDILYDVAFTLMDLGFRAQVSAASRLMNGWLDQAARHSELECPAWSGLAALPLCLSLRAAVRCHVKAAAGEFGTARAYLDAAIAHLEPRPTSLTAIGGLSGSGKSTHARRIAPSLGRFPGAVILRSDEIRKRLWQVAPTEPLPQTAYAADQSERVYKRLFAEASLCLSAGQAVVLDAVFLQPEQRSAAVDLANRCGVRFEGLWMEAPPQELARRILTRTDDASDADLAVLDHQLKIQVGETGWQSVQTLSDD